MTTHFSAFTEPVDFTEPVKLTLSPSDGRLLGSNARYEKKVSELEGVYRDSAAYERLARTGGDTVVYWVESCNTQPDSGGLITGLSILQPGTVGEEYFMTRGHLHVHTECAETYVAIRGHGVMLLETVDGQSRAVELVAGEAVYVPGGWIHRSVNVGPDMFVTLFCYSSQAGQNYDIIARAGGMKQLIVVDGDGWAMRPNSDHAGYGG